MVTPLAAQTGTDAGLLADHLLALLPGIIAASLLMVSLGGLFLAMWLHAGRGAARGVRRGVSGAAARAGARGWSGSSRSSARRPATRCRGGGPGAADRRALLVQGIAVMHGMVRAKGMHRAWLFAGWATLVVLSPWAMMGFAFYGLADTLMDLRRRAAGKV
jgi:hypothetical protein